MPVQWQNLDLPIGRGLDANTSEAALPPGTPRALTNANFTRDGALQKRAGFDTKLGNALGSGGNSLVSSSQRLLAQSAGVLYDYSSGSNAGGGVTGAFASRGSYRAVPTTSQVIKSLSGDLSVCDVYSTSGYTALAYVASGATTVQVFDEVTGAMLGSQTYPSSASRVQVLGTGGVNFANFYVVVGAVIAAARVLNGAVTFDANATTFASGSFSVSRAILAGPNIVCVAIGSSGVGYALVDQNTLAASVTSVTAQSVASNSPIAITTNGSTFYVALHTGAQWGYQSGTTSTGVLAGFTALSSTAAVPANAAFAPVVANRSILFYDDSTYAGTPSSLIYQCVAFSPGGPGVPSVFMRSVSLATDIIASGSRTYLGVVYYSKVTAAVPNSISTNAAASLAALASIATLNSAFLVVDAGANICARVLRQSALTMASTSSASVTPAGIVFAARALSAADATTIITSLALGAAAIVRFNLTSEKPIATTAVRDLITVGGSPTSYDGTSVNELGFHVYPEIIAATAPDPFGIFVTTAAARNTNFKLGDITCYRGTYNPAPNQLVGQVYVCVIAGKTGSSAPASVTSKIVDGTATFQAVGLRAPRIYGIITTIATGDTVIPTTPNGYVYVATNLNSSGGATGTEPVWPTTLGATVISNGGGSTGITYTCAATANTNQLAPANTQIPLGYTYVGVWAWVDDQGQKHRSMASVPSGTTIGVANTPYGSICLVTMTTLRLTSKANARLELYRTAGNGTLAKLIQIFPNDTTVDAIGYIDTVPDATQASGAILYQGPLGAGAYPNSPPPSCSTVTVFGQRVAANNLENPLAVNISQLVSDGFGVAFSDNLTQQLNGAFGTCNALIQMDDKLVIFQDRAISILQGDGPDNTGAGTQFAPSLAIATDVGCTNPSSLVLTPKGIVFQSGKGVYLLTRDLHTEFIGEAIQNTLVSTIVSAVVDPTTHQAVFVTTDATNNVFVWDYEQNSWGVWSVGGTTKAPASICAFNGRLAAIDSAGQVTQQSGAGYTDIGATPAAYQFSVELSATRLAGVQGYARAKKANVLIASTGSPAITVAVKENYSATAAYTLPAMTMTAALDSFQALFRNQKLESIGLVITESTPGGALAIEGVTFLVGVKGGVKRTAPGKRVG